MSAKCLCIGDPHFKVRNLNVLEEYCHKIYSLVKEHSPDFIVVMGDLLDTHEIVHTIVFNNAVKFIATLSSMAPTYLLVGNHDYINNQQYLTTNHPFNSFKMWDKKKFNITVVDDVIMEEYADMSVILMPYVPAGRMKEALDSRIDDWESCTCVFAHQEIRGSKMGAFESVNGDVWDADMPMLISGHIHDKQRIGDNVVYVGSSMQHSFGERSDKTVAIATIGDEGIAIEEISLNMKSKKTIYIDIDKIDEFNAEEYSNAEIKLCVKANIAEFTAFKKTRRYKELSKNRIIIAPKITKQDALSIKHIMTAKTVNGTYLEILKAMLTETKNDELIKLYNSMFEEKIPHPISQHSRIQLVMEEETIEDEKNIDDEEIAEDADAVSGDEDITYL